MRIALINPRWHFEGSIYFGCRVPHLPLELRTTQVLLICTLPVVMAVRAVAGYLNLYLTNWVAVRTAGGA